jgi:murein DD-endopeptidase MepM/ murein hydrolase activator NlpD
MKQIFYFKGLLVLSIMLLLAGPSAFSQEQKPQEEDTSKVDDPKSQAEAVEESFQDFIDTIYQANDLLADTFGWNSRLINSGRFDSKNMTDTICIPLKDKDGNRIYVAPFQNYVTSGFGPRRFIFHYGMDIKLQVGDTVRAAMDGVVRVSKFDKRGYGNVLVIRHRNGLETIYGHLSKPLVEYSEMVRAGQPIGLGGNTGRSTGSHLHLETRYYGEPFDPNCFYDFANQTLKRDTLVLNRDNFAYLVEIRKAKYCTIRSGDNLGRIARRYHTSITKLCKLNRISKKTILRIGRKIRYQ